MFHETCFTCASPCLTQTPEIRQNGLNHSTLERRTWHIYCCSSGKRRIVAILFFIFSCELLFSFSISSSTAALDFIAHVLCFKFTNTWPFMYFDNLLFTFGYMPYCRMHVSSSHLKWAFFVKIYFFRLLRNCMWTQQ